MWPSIAGYKTAECQSDTGYCEYTPTGLSPIPESQYLRYQGRGVMFIAAWAFVAVAIASQRRDNSG
jgi:hypothetical protein